MSAKLPFTLSPLPGPDVFSQLAHKRMVSLDSASVPKPRAKGNVPKRLSLQTQASLPPLPTTSADWNQAVAEVKRHYINRRYRPCSARCCEILDNVRDHSKVESAYLIYLHFYAASSVEMLARPLNPSSPYRIRLLHQARNHYYSAADLIDSADETMSRSSRPSSAATFRSGRHTPSTSISLSEASSSPASVCSNEDAYVTKLSPPPSMTRPKKRVTFDGFPEEEVEALQEPLIRPDSPTLGCDEVSPRAQSPLDPREPPIAPKQPPHNRTSHLRLTPEPLIEGEGSDLAFSYLREQSVHRYCTILSGLRSQVAAHLAAIQLQLAPPPHMGAAPGARFSFSVPSRAASPASGSDDELRVLDLRARIERLRATGWNRPRFDGRRYEELCDNVIAELSS